MKIVVCIKVVPQGIGNLRISEGRDRVICEGSLVAVNESDSYALEEGMALKEQCQGEVIALTVGSLKSQEALYAGLARGAERALRLNADLGDPAATAGVLAQAIKRLEPDLVLTGVESWDTLAAQTGVCLAMKLGVPFAYGVTRVEPLPSGWVRVTKELGGGAYQELEMALPAVLCIQSGIRPVDYIPVVKLLHARRRPVESWGLSDLATGEEETPRQQWFEIAEVFTPQKARRVQIIPGEVSQVSRALLEKIAQAMS